MVKTLEEPTGGEDLYIVHCAKCEEQLGYLIVPKDTKQIWYANIICSDCYKQDPEGDKA